jgi:cbb3-type cytochrome oxidase subunit 3
MPEWIVILVLNGWLVAAVVLFAIIALWAFSPGSRERMDRHANIPFAAEESPDGDA